MSFHLITSAPSTDCPPAQVIGTRGAILALSGSYNPKCHYIITDYSDGNRLNGVSIELHAVDSDSLSKNVSVLTSYDAEAWVGEYSIAANQITKLQDRVGNVVHGAQAVQRFDWGNVRYSDNQILDNSTVLTTIGQTGFFMTHCTIRDGITLDLQGKPSGIISTSRFDGGGNIFLNGPLALLSTTFTNGCSINFGSDVGGTLTRCTFNGLVNAVFGNVALNWNDSVIDNSYGSFVLRGSTPCVWGMNSCSLSAVQVGSNNAVPVPANIQMINVRIKGGLIQFSSAVATIGNLAISDSTIEDTTIQQNTGSFIISASELNGCIIQQLGGNSSLNLLSSSLWNSSVSTLATHTSSDQIQLQHCRFEKGVLQVTKPAGAVNLFSTNLRLNAQIFDDTNGPIALNSCELDEAAWNFTSATHPGYTMSLCRHRRMSGTLTGCVAQVQMSFDIIFNTAISYSTNQAALVFNSNNWHGGSVQILNTSPGTLTLTENRFFGCNLSISGGVPQMSRYEGIFTNIILSNNSQNNSDVVVLGGSLTQGVFSLVNAFLPKGTYVLAAGTVNAHRPLATAYPNII